MKTLNLTQGTAEWLEARMSHFTASEAPAMMGASKYHSRTQLLDHKKGWITEVDEHTKRLFEKGHSSEEAARPIVEEMIGEELYPVVGVLEGTKYLASFDGLTMMEDLAFEHKLFGKVLSENVLNNMLDPHYYWQLEHQLMVSGAEKVIFVTSDGTKENMAHMYYEPVPGRREELIAGWEQFEKDLANHEMKAKTEKVVAQDVTTLPVIEYEMNGLALTSNLNDFKAAADALVLKANSTIETDQDFADAEARQKVFTKAESDIKAVAERVLSEAVDIEKFTKDLNYIGEQIRQARLAENKQIKSRKEEIKLNILNTANDEVAKHCAIFAKLGLQAPSIDISITDAMKGKKTIDSLKDAAETAVSKIKIELDTYHRTASANAQLMKDYSEYRLLFADWKSIAFKSNDDFEALVKSRIADHKEEEQKRIEAERAKIRAEEQAKLKREADEKARNEQIEEQRAKIQLQRDTDETTQQESPKAENVATQSTPKNATQQGAIKVQLNAQQKAFVRGFMVGYNQPESLINPQSEAIQLALKEFDKDAA
ncbi:MAG: YqaJ viral recombinase family protein [Glaciecola sp.]|jgi:putative phage-type endonuclease